MKVINQWESVSIDIAFAMHELLSNQTIGNEGQAERAKGADLNGLFSEHVRKMNRRLDELKHTKGRACTHQGWQVCLCLCEYQSRTKTREWMYRHSPQSRNERCRRADIINTGSMLYDKHSAANILSPLFVQIGMGRCHKEMNHASIRFTGNKTTKN